MSVETIKHMPEHSRSHRCCHFAHNHPSGNLEPSEADRRAHQQLTEAAKILGLRVLDHLIVTRKGYFSFQEAGLLHE